MKKVNLLILVSLIIGFASCEKEDDCFTPTPTVDTTEVMFRIINYSKYVESGDVTPCKSFSTEEIPAVYIQGYTRLGYEEVELLDFYIPVNGRAGDFIFRYERLIPITAGYVTVLPYEVLRKGYYLVDMHYESHSVKRIDFEVTK